MIAEYDIEQDDFTIETDAGLRRVSAEEMKELIETAQYAIAQRLEITGKFTI